MAARDGVPKNQIRIGNDYKKRCIISKKKMEFSSSTLQKQEVLRLYEKTIFPIRSDAILAVFQVFHENVCIFRVD